MARFYVDLGEVTDENRARVRSMSSDDVMEVAARVLAPYTVEVKQVAWFSIYEVAQRLTDAFDDATRREGLPRVFIAGDACHTHSAKAGQGMNASASTRATWSDATGRVASCDRGWVSRCGETPQTTRGVWSTCWR